MTTNIPLILTARKQETHDTESFYFRAQHNQSFCFKPGQFALLQFNVGNNTYIRAYSICSLPNDDVLQITVKRVVDGIISNWLIDSFNVGQIIILTGIQGQFNIIDCPSKDKILFISAGCGITPVMSMAKYLLLNDKKDVHFLHCAKDENNIIFHSEMSQLNKEYDSFKSDLLLEKSANTSNYPISGLIEIDKLLKVCPDLHERSVFLCGPMRFMQAVENLLLQHSFPMAHFYQESFTPSETEQSNTSEENEQVMLSVPEFSINKLVSKSDVLLNILEEANVPIIGACRAGVCGSCRCKVESGLVESSSTMTLSEEDIAAGYHLACSSKVMSDVTISLK